MPSLFALNELSEIALVVTRPDRPRGRSGTPRPPPVRIGALELGLPVLQPRNRDELVEVLLGSAPYDLGVVTAYGMILPPAALGIPRKGMINLHFSLLPRWRGASPVQAAILNGDQETGVSVMLMDEGLDTGPVLAAATTPIGDVDTGATLSSRLATLSSTLLTTCFPALVHGTTPAIAQSGPGSHAPLLTAQDRQLRITMSVEEFLRRVRALSPRPGAWLLVEDEPHKVLAAGPSRVPAAPGTVVVSDGEAVLGLNRGSIEILTVQPPGRKPMAAADWLRGLQSPPRQFG